MYFCVFFIPIVPQTYQWKLEAVFFVDLSVVVLGLFQHKKNTKLIMSQYWQPSQPQIKQGTPETAASVSSVVSVANRLKMQRELELWQENVKLKQDKMLLTQQNEYLNIENHKLTEHNATTTKENMRLVKIELFNNQLLQHVGGLQQEIFYIKRQKKLEFIILVLLAIIIFWLCKDNTKKT